MCTEDTSRACRRDSSPSSLSSERSPPRSERELSPTRMIFLFYLRLFCATRMEGTYWDGTSEVRSPGRRCFLLPFRVRRRVGKSFKNQGSQWKKLRESCRQASRKQ